MIETALLGLCAAGIKAYAAKAGEHSGRMAIEIGGELVTVVFAHSATGTIQKARERFAKWIGENHPPGNEDLERAVAGSLILADLFCLMEAEPGTIEDHKWLQRARKICPKGLLGTPPFGVLTAAAVDAIGKAKVVCEKRLKTFEENFKPAGFDPACLLSESADVDFWAKLASKALAELERKAVDLPERVHDVFGTSWFSYLCLSFHNELKENQKVANIFIATRQAAGFAKLGKRLDELGLTVRVEAEATRKTVIDEAKATRKTILVAKKEIIGEIRHPNPPAPRVYDETAYFRALRIDTKHIELDELKVERDKTPLPVMDALYFPLMTTARADERRDPKGRKDKAIEPAGTPKPIGLEKALEERRLIVEGGPGSGKTTFLRRIAWALCREDKQNESLRLPFSGFPMFVRIRELDQHIAKTLDARRSGDPTLWDDHQWIAHFLSSHDWGLDRAYFEEKLQSPESVLLLDGLDEAADAGRRKHIAKLITVGAERHACRYVVTTRPGADEAAAAIPALRKTWIAPLDDAGTRAFLRQWSLWLKQDEKVANDYSRGLLEAVTVTDRRLRSNPLMLTALAVLYLQKKHLPEQRADLYEAIMQWLGQKAADKAADYTLDQCLLRFGTLALEMQESKGSRKTRIGIEDAAGLIAFQFRTTPGPEKRAAAVQFLERAQVESGIVTLSEGHIEFWHLSFQEYLAARALKNVGSDDLLSKRAKSFLYSEEGREVLPLVAGSMAGPAPTRLDFLFSELILEGGWRKAAPRTS